MKSDVTFSEVAPLILATLSKLVADVRKAIAGEIVYDWHCDDFTRDSGFREIQVFQRFSLEINQNRLLMIDCKLV